jgi:hypothetical protein
MNEELRRWLKTRAIARQLTPQQEASYYLDEYMSVLNNENLEEHIQLELSKFYLELYYQVLEE